MENKPNSEGTGAGISDILLMPDKALHLKTLGEKNPDYSFFPEGDSQGTNSKANRTGVDMSTGQNHVTCCPVASSEYVGERALLQRGY